MTGKFIVLEGIDGSGTTTQAQRLAHYLFEKDKQNLIVLTREPTKCSSYGKELRRRLEQRLLPGEKKIDDPAYWADLFISDRRWHLAHVVVPNIRLGLQVISDRHKLSTIAYQSAQGAEMNELIYQHKEMHPPDLTLLLDLSAEEAAQRLWKARDAPEYFDNLNLQEKIRQNYLKAVAQLKDTEKIVIIDGTQSLDAVAQKIQREVSALYRY